MADKATFDIFVNYRRQDTRADTGRLYDRLSTHFGDEHVFMDIDDINPGQNFVQILDDTLDYCAALLVVIGTSWIDSLNEDGERRLDQENDFVRLEIQRAIERDITIIPILVGRASMPTADELPAEISILSQHQALEISDKRFHPDVDRLIAELETINGGKISSKKTKPILRWSLAMLILLGIASSLYYGVNAYQAYQSSQKEIEVHLEVGDQFLEQQNFVEAINEFDKALNIDPENIEPYRRSISAYLELMLRKAFLYGTSLNIGLRHDFSGSFAPMKSELISEVLNLIYTAQALDPSLKEDPELLLDEALILKSSSLSAKKAIKVLEKAKKLDPRNSAILAELGLLNAVLLHKSEGIKDINLASEISPDVARYHFYLARALAELYGCTGWPKYTGTGGDAEGCARAIKEYHRAAVLANGEDVWSKHIYRNAITSSLGIFHRYAFKDDNILTPNLAMSIDDRIKELEFLIPVEHRRSRSGLKDYPRYWLALLYESKKQLKKASQLMHELIKERNYRSVLWMEYQAKLLEASGHEPEELNKIRSLLDKKIKN